MRILLDESLPRPLSRLLIGHDVSTVAREGWTSLGNGALLRQAATTFDVVLTADQNIEFQQNLATLPLAVVVVPEVLDALKNLKARTFLRVGGITLRVSRAPRRHDGISRRRLQALLGSSS